VAGEAAGSAATTASFAEGRTATAVILVFRRPGAAAWAGSVCCSLAGSQLTSVFGPQTARAAASTSARKVLRSHSWVTPEPARMITSARPSATATDQAASPNQTPNRSAPIRSRTACWTPSAGVRAHAAAAALPMGPTLREPASGRFACIRVDQVKVVVADRYVRPRRATAGRV